MPDQTPVLTADIVDAFPDARSFHLPLHSFGGHEAFSGPIRTVRTVRDAGPVRSAIERAAEGDVLVIDGLGILDCALMGDRVAGLAIEHGIRGVIINGCIRDSAALAQLPIGVLALGANPTRPARSVDHGDQGVVVHFAGITWTPGSWVYRDADGVVLADSELRR
jgi:regulator of ribonuclease activity A